jgi:hypothetical protein
MASASLGLVAGGVVPAPVARVIEAGSAAHPWPRSEALLRGPAATRNLADAVHCLCALHGRHPSVIDHAGVRPAGEPISQWLAAAGEAFADERALLGRLAAAAGPIPSTPDGQQAEAALAAQRHAIDVLARSERSGCALGAALALVADWSAIRQVLAVAADRFGVSASVSRLSRPDALVSIVGDVESAAERRAMLFAAEQIAHQHFGLWDLLEARALAREER